MRKLKLTVTLVFMLVMNNIIAQTFTNYTTANGLVDNYITSIAIDNEGNKWFGTYGGVSKFDGTNWTTYTTENGLASDAIRSIIIDSQGNKWFGTSDGITKLVGTNWTSYTTANGLINNTVFSITIDAQDNKWIGTYGGVSKMQDASGVETINSVSKISISPNPACNTITISNIAEWASNTTVTIFDLQGKQIMQKQFTANQTPELNISSLQKGIYFVKINTGNVSKSLKFIKE